MFAQCTCNEGFEDQLTVGTLYPCAPIGGSVAVHNDKGQARYYGTSKFKLVAGH